MSGSMLGDKQQGQKKKTFYLIEDAGTRTNEYKSAVNKCRLESEKGWQT